MFRTAALVLALAVPAHAQQTVPVEDAPFKEAGTLGERLEPTGDGIPVSDLTPAQIVGTRVVDVTGQRIGSISDVTVEGETITGLIIEVGGVLGAFDSPRLLDPASVEITNPDRAGLQVLLTMTEAELAELPEYTASDAG